MWGDVESGVSILHRCSLNLSLSRRLVSLFHIHQQILVVLDGKQPFGLDNLSVNALFVELTPDEAKPGKILNINIQLNIIIQCLAALIRIQSTK